jgi:hypothetical protein
VSLGATTDDIPHRYIHTACFFASPHLEQHQHATGNNNNNKSPPHTKDAVTFTPLLPLVVIKENNITATEEPKKTLGKWTVVWFLLEGECDARERLVQFGHGHRNNNPFHGSHINQRFLFHPPTHPHIMELLIQLHDCFVPCFISHESPSS